MSETVSIGKQTRVVFGREIEVSGAATVAPAIDIGDRPQFAWLPLGVLQVDPRYQRRITQDGNVLINRIVREFHWSKFQPLTVTGPDASGDYPVIDGQHRMEACRRHGGIEEVPCWIVPAPKIADQARSFIAVNKSRIGVTRINVFWASLAAQDPDAMWMKRVCDRAGVEIGKVGTGRQPPLTTVALASLMKLKPLGDDLVVRGLSVLAKAQAEAENAFRSASIIAVTKLLGIHGDRLDEARMVEKLSEMDLDQEIEKARVYCKTFGGNTEAALQVIFIRAYNARLADDRRLPEKV